MQTNERVVGNQIEKFYSFWGNVGINTVTFYRPRDISRPSINSVAVNRFYTRPSGQEDADCANSNSEEQTPDPEAENDAAALKSALDAETGRTEIFDKLSEV